MSSGGDTHGEGGPRRVLICLMRLDLRVNDNALFHYAHMTEPLPGPAAERPPTKLNQDVLAGSALFSRADYLMPLYVFDERIIELSGLPGYERNGPEARTKNYGFWKTGGFRARFIAEAVYDLRSRLRAAGSDLVIRFGFPEVVVENFVKAFQARGDEVEGVWLQKEVTHDEEQLETQLQERLQGLNVPMRFVHGKTLVHPADLPFDISETPDVFTPYRKRVEEMKAAMVRPTLRPPERFKPLPPALPETPDYSLDVSYEVDVDGLLARPPEDQAQTESQVSFLDILSYLLAPLSDSPTILSAGKPIASRQLLQQRHPASAFPNRGGESSALERLEWYFIRGKSADSSRWGRADPPPVARYKQTRNNLVGHAYSTKMSPFLAYGSISPRQIWEALDIHERQFGEDRNTYWVRFELLWRDYFFCVSEKYGDLLFKLEGFEGATDPRQAEKKLQPGWWKMWDPVKDGRENPVSRLLEGRTGIPFIDANITELRESGFMSNRGRQNVASFLTKDLGYDWRIGAEFYQGELIDYDATSNYGNWQYVAGVGNDPRASRQFNIIKQAKDYDSHGEFVKLWLPALRNLHPDFVHTPWLLNEDEKRSYGLKSTIMDISYDSYPGQPMVEEETWRKHYERKEGVGSKMFGNPQEKVKDGKVKRNGKRTMPTYPRGLTAPGSSGAPALKLGPSGTGAIGAQHGAHRPPPGAALPAPRRYPLAGSAAFANASSTRSASPFDGSHHSSASSGSGGLQSRYQTPAPSYPPGYRSVGHGLVPGAGQGTPLSSQQQQQIANSALGAGPGTALPNYPVSRSSALPPHGRSGGDRCSGSFGASDVAGLNSFRNVHIGGAAHAGSGDQGFALPHGQRFGGGSSENSHMAAAALQGSGLPATPPYGSNGSRQSGAPRNFAEGQVQPQGPPPPKPADTSTSWRRGAPK
ncbi:deoxyribodipyrimidine photolyase [Ceraceosorus bombacis]|uniref:Deoxyribodipyrimidine photolyase n=1 Tax=Ceraceosorus bombacis TaxID=401625 RepID=A0A0P1BM60_9BASI|nr:deoxyribodipyrimidine photolyase [Ceraceosorus bombacis]